MIWRWDVIEDPNELERLVTNAQSAGLTLSAYLRWRGLQGAAPQAPRRPADSKTTRTPRRTSR